VAQIAEMLFCRDRGNT